VTKLGKKNPKNPPAVRKYWREKQRRYRARKKAQKKQEG
jgi:hypothetical protein